MHVRGFATVQFINGKPHTIIPPYPGQTVKGQTDTREYTRMKRRRAFEKANPGQEYVDGRTREARAKKRRTNSTLSSQQTSPPRSNPAEANPGFSETHAQPDGATLASRDPITSQALDRGILPKAEDQDGRHDRSSDGPSRQQKVSVQIGTTEYSEMPAARHKTDTTTTAASRPPAEEDEAKPNPSTREGHAVAYDEVYAFLARLPIDLSCWSDELRVKGMGTEEELLAPTVWGEEYLDRVLTKLVPKMPELHRYVLAEGILDLAASRRINSEC